eukprot:5512460-Amphidinium_carterae.1
MSRLLGTNLPSKYQTILLCGAMCAPLLRNAGLRRWLNRYCPNFGSRVWTCPAKRLAGAIVAEMLLSSDDVQQVEWQQSSPHLARH